MGIRIGGRLGPISASTGVSARETSSCLGVLIGFALVAIALFVLINLAPIVAVGWGVLTLTQSPTKTRRVLAITAVVLGLGGAALLWPYEYIRAKYYEDVPDVTGVFTEVDEARRDLAAAGFTNVEVRTEGEHGGESYCSVDRQQPMSSEQADTRKPVILFEICSPPANGSQTPDRPAIKGRRIPSEAGDGPYDENVRHLSGVVTGHPEDLYYMAEIEINNDMYRLAGVWTMHNVPCGDKNQYAVEALLDSLRRLAPVGMRIAAIRAGSSDHLFIQTTSHTDRSSLNEDLVRSGLAEANEYEQRDVFAEARPYFDAVDKAEAAAKVDRAGTWGVCDLAVAPRP